MNIGKKKICTVRNIFVEEKIKQQQTQKRGFILECQSADNPVSSSCASTQSLPPQKQLNLVHLF
jgi:hypothetical protein